MKTRENGFALRVTATLAIVGILGGAAGAPAGIAREAAAQQPAYLSAESPMQSAAPTPAELQQLVAPIALYPDALVAQILAAATYPEQIVEADRWMEVHRGLEGQALAEQVDREAWDPSVKALTAFPSVLANMDGNLAWTSSLDFRVVPKRADDETTRGLAFVAYPAEYRSSGVMTFVVTDDGALWEKDLGPDTPIVAPELDGRPASGWHAVKTDPATHG